VRSLAPTLVILLAFAEVTSQTTLAVRFAMFVLLLLIDLEDCRAIVQ